MRTALVLCIVLAGCKGEQPKPPTFNPQDITETKKWLAQVTRPYVEALSDRNVYRLSEAKQQVADQIKALPKDVQIKWVVDFISVDPSTVLVNTLMEDRAMLTMYFSPDTRPDGSFDAMDKLRIGKSIEFSVAKGLKSGDKLIIVGILKDLKPQFDDEKKFASFAAIITNAKATK